MTFLIRPRHKHFVAREIGAFRLKIERSERILGELRLEQARLVGQLTRSNDSATWASQRIEAIDHSIRRRQMWIRRFRRILAGLYSELGEDAC
jgi:hypothetical protein